MLYSDPAKLVIVKNPKVMSTSSKFIIDALNNDGVVPKFAPNVGDSTIMGKLSMAERKRRLQGYEIAAFIRNPYARMYSVWTNKVRDSIGACPVTKDGKRHCTDVYRNWVRNSKRILGKLAVPFNATGDPDGVLRLMTWPRFLEGVLLHAVWDKHLEEQVTLRSGKPL